MEEARIEVNAGLLVGARGYPGLLVNDGKIGHSHPSLDGIVLQDVSCRDPSDYKSFRPYRPSRQDICRPGRSSVVEIPVFSYFKEIEDDPKGVVESFERYWSRRKEVDVDIVHFFWHPWEMLHWQTDTVNMKVIDGFHTVFSEVARFRDVVFSTAGEAAQAWKESQQAARSVACPGRCR